MLPHLSKRMLLKIPTIAHRTAVRSPLRRRPTISPAQVGEHFKIEQATVVNPIIIVFTAEKKLDPPGGLTVPTVIELAEKKALPGHEPFQLECELRPDRHQIRRVARKVGQAVQRITPLQLLDRPRVIIDRDDHVAVVQRSIASPAPKDQQGGGLLPAD